MIEEAMLNPEIKEKDILSLINETFLKSGAKNSGTINKLTNQPMESYEK
jgi:hypothetical protein